jgi:hypothetical protein
MHRDHLGERRQILGVDHRRDLRLVEQLAIPGQHSEQMLTVVGVNDDRSTLLEHLERLALALAQLRDAHASRRVW